MSPSARGASLFPDRFARAVAALECSLDVKVITPERFERANGALAGTAAERASDFSSLLADPRTTAIMTTYGGYNSNEILSHLDPALMARHKKIVIGYSDTTALLLAYQAFSGCVAFYGPAVLPQFGEFPVPLPYTIARLRAALSGEFGAIPAPQQWTDGCIDWMQPPQSRTLMEDHGALSIRDGEAQGVLWGGNLPTINALLGTRFLRELHEAVILFVETAEHVSTLEMRRSLVHLRDSDAGRGVRAVLIGRVSTRHDASDAEVGSMVAEIFGDVPIAVRWAFGHTDPMMTIPIGVHATVVVNGSEPVLRIEEAAVEESP